MKLTFKLLATIIFVEIISRKVREVYKIYKLKNEYFKYSGCFFNTYYLNKIKCSIMVCLLVISWKWFMFIWLFFLFFQFSIEVSRFIINSFISCSVYLYSLSDVNIAFYILHFRIWLNLDLNINLLFDSRTEWKLYWFLFEEKAFLHISPLILYNVKHFLLKMVYWYFIFYNYGCCARSRHFPIHMKYCS